MALKLDLVGTRTDPTRFDYAWQDAVRYALGVGARIDELDFLYEGRGPRVLPTFAVVPAFKPLLTMIRQLELDLKAVVHGEQSITLHRPIPPSASVETVAECTGIYDKGKGALVIIETRSSAGGEPLFDNVFSIFVRGAGGFGGERGPEAVKADPPEGVAPDFEVTEATSPEQAALYRLAGDENPLHIDPDFAKKAGFDRPILHGLCTYGFAGRALVAKACGGDPAKLKTFGARFSGVVFPGDTLTTRGWKTDAGRYVVQVQQQDGQVVLSNAACEVQP